MKVIRYTAIWYAENDPPQEYPKPEYPYKKDGDDVVAYILYLALRKGVKFSCKGKCYLVIGPGFNKCSGSPVEEMTRSI